MQQPLSLLSWNIAHRACHARQAAAITSIQPSIVALQEVTASAVPVLNSALSAAGLVHIADSFSLGRHTSGEATKARRLGVLLASVWPMQVLPCADIPWPERLLSVEIARQLYSDGIEQDAVKIIFLRWKVPGDLLGGLEELDQIKDNVRAVLQAALGRLFPRLEIHIRHNWEQH